MNVRKTAYDYGFALKEQYRDKGLPEIAVAGKSNVGKSSFINLLAGNSKLARVGQKPGKTVLINVFRFNDAFLLMDLPGYGFARVSNDEKKRWAGLIEGYLSSSERLKGVILLLDIRHEPGQGDKEMLHWLQFYHVPFLLCATKADKLSASAQKKALQTLSVATGVITSRIFPVSAQTKQGKDAILSAMDEMLARDLTAEAEFSSGT
ncbi:MAG: YihA family ribosome biogenesis GTP-binding protein [Clostridia bacterium]|nr:YihA family ribosome biogenesis GTP-binding protein [Clostridia bacterium]